MVTLFNIEYCIHLIRHCGYYLFCSSILCSFYSRAATIQERTIQERHLFRSANPSTDVEETKVVETKDQSSKTKVGRLLDRQENLLLVVADWFICCFEAASLVHN